MALLLFSLIPVFLLLGINIPLSGNQLVKAQEAASQQKQILTSIQGYIVDKDTQKALPAFVSVAGTDIGVSADYDGFFRIELGPLSTEKVLRYVYSEGYSIRNNQYSIFGRTVFIGVYLPLF